MGRLSWNSDPCTVAEGGRRGCSSDRVEITGNMILTVEVRIEELLLLIPVLLAVERRHNTWRTPAPRRL